MYRIGEENQQKLSSQVNIYFSCVLGSFPDRLKLENLLYFTIVSVQLKKFMSMS